MGETDWGREVFDAHWPEARAVSDTDMRFYHGFGLKRGGPRQMFGLRNWIRGLQAARRGYRQGAAVGDPWMMPGAFLVEGERVLWMHRYRVAGDEPDWSELGPWTVSA